MIEKYEICEFELENNGVANLIAKLKEIKENQDGHVHFDIEDNSVSDIKSLLIHFKGR